MFLKTNQGLGRTYRNKKRTKEQKQNQTKPNQKEEEEEEKKSHTSKDLRTGINGGLRQTKESGWTANIPSIPYCSGIRVKLRYSICLIIQMHESV